MCITSFTSPPDLPLYNSNPHCLGCDPEYFKTVSGYYPTRSKHESYVDIEPVSKHVAHVDNCYKDCNIIPFLISLKFGKHTGDLKANFGTLEYHTNSWSYK